RATQDGQEPPVHRDPRRRLVLVSVGGSEHFFPQDVFAVFLLHVLLGPHYDLVLAVAVHHVPCGARPVHMHLSHPLV
ncbi:MAG: hypothetical protein ACT4P5_18110, partial [Armatimonadota bacterium]